MTGPARDALTGPVPPGFFGKVPGRGDFVSRRVPATFRADWEAWLAGLVVAAREALGASWPDDWLTAPLWHFTLGRDMVPPLGGAGVLVASMDRVGRFYPFTVLGFAYAAPHDGTGFHDWAGSAEALTLGALEDGFDPNGLDAALVGLGPPPVLSGPMKAAGCWPLVLDGDWPSDVALQAPGAAQSTWFCRGSDRVPAMLLRCTSLPDRATAAAMITGDFPALDCLSGAESGSDRAVFGRDDAEDRENRAGDAHGERHQDQRPRPDDR